MLALWGNIAETVFAICKFLAIYRTVIIAFSLKRYCSKLALLKSVLSVQIDPLLDHIICSTSIEKKSDHVRRRVARIWKRGGYFERVRSVQTTLTRIVIALESVSHGLHENWDENRWRPFFFFFFWRPPDFGRKKPRKLKGFFRPKSGGLQKKKKKKKVFTDLAEISNSKVFFAQNQAVSKKKKKKKVFTDFETGCSGQLGILNVWGGLFSYGGRLFLIFHQKSTSKPPKRCDFAYFTSQWGGLEPPPATLLHVR